MRRPLEVSGNQLSLASSTMTIEERAEKMPGHTLVLALEHLKFHNVPCRPTSTHGEGYTHPPTPALEQLRRTTRSICSEC
jgi:hypothetical protein